MTREKYNFITLNVNGLHNPVKRGKVIAKMKREKQDVIFWQETHLSDTEHEKLKKWLKNLYYSSFKHGNARGVSILISNHVNFQFTSQVADADGRYILVKGFIDHKEVTLVNIYRPPGHNKQFTKKVFDLLCMEMSGVVICGGDWNIHLHPSLDSSSKAKNIQSEALHIKKIMKELGMMDVWRDIHPHEKVYTFFFPLSFYFF